MPRRRRSRKVKSTIATIQPSSRLISRASRNGNGNTKLRLPPLQLAPQHVQQHQPQHVQQQQPQPVQQQQPQHSVESQHTTRLELQSLQLQPQDFQPQPHDFQEQPHYSQHQHHGLQPQHQYFQQQQPHNFPLQPEDFLPQPHDFLPQPHDFLQQPPDFLQQPPDFQQQPHDFLHQQQPHNFQQQPHDFQQQSHNFQQPHDFQPQPHDFQQQPHDFQPQPHDFQQQPHDFQQEPHDFQVQPNDFQQQPHNFQQQPHDFQQQPQHAGLELQDFKPQPHYLLPQLQLKSSQPPEEFVFKVPMIPVSMPKPQPGSMIAGLLDSLETTRTIVPLSNSNLFNKLSGKALWYIMRRLSTEDKKNASLVCKRWERLLRYNFKFKRSAMTLNNESFRFLGKTKIFNSGFTVTHLTDLAFLTNFPIRPLIQVIYFKNPIIEYMIMLDLIKACPNLQYIRVELYVNPISPTLGMDEARARMFLSNHLFWTLALCKNLRKLEIFCGWTPSAQEWVFDCASLTSCTELTELNLTSYGNFRVISHDQLPYSLMRLDMTMFSPTVLREDQKAIRKDLYTHLSLIPQVLSEVNPPEPMMISEFKRTWTKEINRRFPNMEWYHVHPLILEQVKHIVDTLPEVIRALQMSPAMCMSVIYFVKNTFGKFHYTHQFENVGNVQIV